MTAIDYDAVAKWSQVGGFVVFAIATVWVFMKFITPAVRTAAANTNNRIAEAERHRDEAKAAVEKLRGEIDGAKHDAVLIRSRGDEAGRREASAIVAEARESGERTLRNAQGELDRSRVAAREAFREELAQKALDLARGEANNRVDASVNNQLVDAFVSSLEKGARN